MKKYYIPIIISIIFSILLCLFFSYRILDVPMGITTDEDAMGYNAILLSRSGRDENGRFLPIFVLSNNGSDWKQPITQYYLTILFWLFKPSIFLLRFSSVLITLVSSFLIYFLSHQIFDKKYAVVTLLLFLTTPLIMIQSHMGLDNIMPVPFTIIWVWGLFLFQKKSQLKYLTISAIALGVTFYTYKGMRAIFPIWYIISLVYLFYISSSKFIKNIFIFSLFSLPFLLISLYLNKLYPGAIYGGSKPSFDNFYNFFYPYLSSFDPTFLFIKGDDLLFHSTGYHGMFLLASLPIFMFGIYSSIKTSKLSRFILASFFFAPLLFGTVNSVHRASRLMCLIPLYSIICTYGVQYIINSKINIKKNFLLFIFLSIVFNYYDFCRYYFFDYAKITQSFVGDLKYYLSFKELKKNSMEYNLTPYVAIDISHKLFESIYFENELKYIHQDLLPPSGSILLTNREHIDGMENLKNNMLYYQLQIIKP